MMQECDGLTAECGQLNPAYVTSNKTFIRGRD